MKIGTIDTIVSHSSLNANLSSNLLKAFALGLAAFFTFSTAHANRAGRDCATETSVLTPMSAANMKALDDVMRGLPSRASAKTSARNVDYSTHALDDSEFKTGDKPEKVAMQIGLGGNPDVDKGKPFREKAWTVAVLYPVKATHVGDVPTTVYAEARCASLGKQPVSAQTDNINIRCGPGVVTDAKMASWLSAYGRLGLVTSRFSHNGAPRGQINPATGREFRLYPNKTGFTGAAMGAGVKVRLLPDTVVFGEYTKYYVQQTDNPAYQFRGGFNAGIARQFWLFQGGK